MFAELRHKGYKLVGKVAKTLGVSQTTLRRMEAEGVIPKAQRLEFMGGRSIRAFTAKEVERIAMSRTRERWRAKHPGRWASDRLYSYHSKHGGVAARAARAAWPTPRA